MMRLLGTIVWIVNIFMAGLVHGQAIQSGGLAVEIIGVTIRQDRRPVATFKLGDTKGRHVELSDLDPNSIKFTIAAIKADNTGATSYHNYILTKVSGKEYVFKGETKKPALAETLQPDFDQGGSFKQIRSGVFTYTFKTALPANYDRNVTHVVGGELPAKTANRSPIQFSNSSLSGANVKVQRSVVETATCNNCHDPLKAHGGTRREVGGLRALPHRTVNRSGERRESRLQSFRA